MKLTQALEFLAQGKRLRVWDDNRYVYLIPGAGINLTTEQVTSDEWEIGTDEVIEMYRGHRITKDIDGYYWAAPKIHGYREVGNKSLKGLKTEIDYMYAFCGIEEENNP